MANVTKQIEQAASHGDEELLSVVDPLKTKGRQSKKNTFYWEKYNGSPAGKRGIMKHWAKEFAKAEDSTTWVDEKGNLHIWRVGNTPKNYKKQATK